jgi:hypothetical protein
MKRRTFLRGTAASVAVSCMGRSRMLHALDAGGSDLNHCTVIIPTSPSRRETVAAEMVVDEIMKRCGISWTQGNNNAGSAKIYLGTRANWHNLGSSVSSVAAKAAKLPAESYAIASGGEGSGAWIAVCGSDERGLIFGAGRMLRMLRLVRRSVAADLKAMNLTSSPHYAVRGHQLGYRPKTNAYDAMTVEMWDQYIRELAIFGTNTIELLPPISDDLSDSPHFPIPPQQMMIEMSRICDKYDLDVSVWYPAMAKDYGDPKTVEDEIRDWAAVLHDLPRVDVVFVPGGDPGHTQPKNMLPLLEKEKISLRTVHPKLQMWMSPQSFNAEWTAEFIKLAADPHTQSWLDGIVFGPQNRLSIGELRKALPKKYPIRFYPDITHSVQSQYSMNNWDLAYALTEGREVINPRPEAEAAILRSELKGTVGFVSYSEGVNDDVNKFVWSLISWDPQTPVPIALRDFGNYIIGARDGSAYAQPMNWSILRFRSSSLLSEMHRPLCSRTGAGSKRCSEPAATLTCVNGCSLNPAISPGRRASSVESKTSASRRYPGALVRNLRRSQPAVLIHRTSSMRPSIFCASPQPHRLHLLSAHGSASSATLCCRAFTSSSQSSASRAKPSIADPRSIRSIILLLTVPTSSSSSAR